MISSPTISQMNLEQYERLLQQVNPELYSIQIALFETGMNPLIIPKVIRSITNIAIGTGHGTVHIIINKNKVTQIIGEESVKVHEDIFFQG